ncbi:MAG: histidinol-phosphatase [Actinomycetota bacterium]|nr:histidinol-phosphatase [Actinomycetota bacterium]
MVQPDLSADLAFAHELADAAAEVTLAWFGHRLPVELKDDETPVTEVDRHAEQAIRAAISSRFPGDAVLGEEEGMREGTNGRRWVIDPVDGTKLYAEGIPLWTTLIALEIDGVPAVGVADAPAIGDRYHAVRGEGAWRDHRRLRVSDVSTLAESFVAHSGMEEWIAGGRGDSLMRVAERARRTRGLSDAWAHLLVAQGSVEALLEHEPCQAWDWAATGIIVEEAGGCLTTLSGETPTAGGDLLVSNGVVHREVVDVLAMGS